MVSREHDAIDAHLEQQVEKCRREVEAAKCVVNVFSKVRADGAIDLRHGHRHNVEPLQHEGERFAHVSDNDLQLWKLVEYSTEDHANDVDGGFDVPAPARARKQLGYDGRKTSIGCVDHRLRRRSWMEIDRHVKHFSTLKDWPEELVVEVTSPIVAIDDRSLEAMFSDHPLQLFGGPVWRGGRQRCKSCKALWISPCGSREEVVRLAGQGNPRGSLELLYAGGSERQDLHIDACGVHLGDSLVTEIRELFEQASSAVAEF